MIRGRSSAWAASRPESWRSGPDTGPVGGPAGSTPLAAGQQDQPLLRDGLQPPSGRSMRWMRPPHRRGRERADPNHLVRLLWAGILQALDLLNEASGESTAGYYTMCYPFGLSGGRRATTSDRPVLLRLESKGHLAGSLDQSIDETTDRHAFLFDQLGLG